ncbi:uncharacterized protein EDB91DRAFT_1146264 [Suillus paluster]|uniref:uncharacterized protein n=1 Tax=Suillus paluster TaxID=48578 RepID=UPI001B86E769|nr:uncharacterized protein EDB91DRAFT_1146264 [Suillus paluster]KAG1734679.1 hypothetical protein EDB91DRAFT_1146264 [Suillus paluster]
MIIPDEDDLKSKDPPVATPALRYPERAAGRRLFSPLPDYETSQALALNDLNDSLITFYKPPPKRRFIDSRSWRAGITALGIYIILSIVIGIPIIVKKSRNDDPQPFPYYASNYADRLDKSTSSHYVTNINNISSSLVENGIVCNNWTDTSQLDDAQGSVVGDVQYTISSNGQFSITSNTSYTSSMNVVLGDLFVGINPNSSEINTIISINMQASSIDLFDQTLVCFALATDITGLSIYTPDNLTFEDQLLFNVTLLYPQSPIPAKVESFATYLPLFTQTFDNFGEYVDFEKVSIEGPVSKIFVGLLEARKILVETSLESIFGQFSASDTLTVSTIQAPINANITLFNDPDSNFPTNLTANVTLNSPNQNPPVRPNFIANLRTFSGQATASFVHDPTSPPTAIKLRLENDLGPATVTFDEKYQGVFQVNTKLGTVAVTQGATSSSDPWAVALVRNYALEYVSSTRAYGWIGWGPRSGSFLTEQQGEIVLETSIADCTLFFDG